MLTEAKLREALALVPRTGPLRVIVTDVVKESGVALLLSSDTHAIGLADYARVRKLADPKPWSPGHALTGVRVSLPLTCRADWGWLWAVDPIAVHALARYMNGEAW